MHSSEITNDIIAHDLINCLTSREVKDALKVLYRGEPHKQGTVDDLRNELYEKLISMPLFHIEKCCYLHVTDEDGRPTNEVTRTITLYVGHREILHIKGTLKEIKKCLDEKLSTQMKGNGPRHVKKSHDIILHDVLECLEKNELVTLLTRLNGETLVEEYDKAHFVNEAYESLLRHVNVSIEKCKTMYVTGKNGKLSNKKEFLVTLYTGGMARREEDTKPILVINGKLTKELQCAKNKLWHHQGNEGIEAEY